MKILVFGEIFDFWRKFGFLAKFFDFWRNFWFLAKIFISGEIFYFWRNFRFSVAKIKSLFQEGFWFHRKCFKCQKCAQLLVFATGNYKEVSGCYYCPSCAPLTTITEGPPDGPLTEPEKQSQVDQIIVKTNVPVPKPRTKFRTKPVRRAETTKPVGSPSYLEYQKQKSLDKSVKSSDKSMSSTGLTDHSSQSSKLYERCVARFFTKISCFFSEI